MVERYKEQHKTVTVSKDYLLELYENFPENIRVLIVRQDDEIVTGMLDLVWKNHVSSWIGNPKPQEKISPSPNDLIIYEALKIACETGCHEYITMSAAGNERLHRYYASKLNPELRVRYVVQRASIDMELLEWLYRQMVRPLMSVLYRP